MWLPYRSWIVLLASAGVLMALFMLFAYVTGWPPVADSCIPKTVMDALKIDPNADIREAFGANECFCEKFNPAALLEWSHGVRQPVNTWFNLYALITSGVSPASCGAIAPAAAAEVP